jgi:5,10-methylenetetrahydromethanopterin reductase
VTHLPERDVPLLEHLEVEGSTSAALMMSVGDPTTVTERITRLAKAGYREVIYTPSGPDVARELTAFARFGHEPN